MKDSDTKAKAQWYGTGLVILSHIHDLMKEHFGFQARTTLDRFFSKEIYTPVGNWKKLQECQDTHTLVDCVEKRHSDAHMVGFDSGGSDFF